MYQEWNTNDTNNIHSGAQNIMPYSRSIEMSPSGLELSISTLSENFTLNQRTEMLRTLFRRMHLSQLNHPWIMMKFWCPRVFPWDHRCIYMQYTSEPWARILHWINWRSPECLFWRIYLQQLNHPWQQMRFWSTGCLSFFQGGRCSLKVITAQKQPLSTG